MGSANIIAEIDDSFRIPDRGLRHTIILRELIRRPWRTGTEGRPLRVSLQRQYWRPVDGWEGDNRATEARPRSRPDRKP